MIYSLHPEALGDLRDAASFYREQAGTRRSHAFWPLLITAVVPGIGRAEGNTPKQKSLSPNSLLRISIKSPVRHKIAREFLVRDRGAEHFNGDAILA